MATEIDELFGEGAGQPEPRTTLVTALLVSGLVLAIAGMLCTAAPGGVLVLVAWSVLEKELDRVESGYLPIEVKPRLLALQRASYAGLVLVILLFVAQMFLFCEGFYEQLWGGMLGMIVEWRGAA